MRREKEQCFILSRNVQLAKTDLVLVYGEGHRVLEISKSVMNKVSHTFSNSFCEIPLRAGSRGAETPPTSFTDSAPFRSELPATPSSTC